MSEKINGIDDTDLGEVKLAPYDPGQTIFLVDDVEFMRFESNGDIFVKNKLIENDHQVVDTFREWLAATRSGAAAARENQINDLKKQIDNLLIEQSKHLETIRVLNLKLL